MRNFAQVFAINSAGWKAMNFWVCSNIWANTIIVPEMILGAFFALAIVLQVEIANTIFGCLGHNGHTWANLGQMYLYDFYKIFRKCLYGYIIWKNAKKTGGHHVGYWVADQNVSCRQNWEKSYKIWKGMVWREWICQDTQTSWEILSMH